MTMCVYTYININKDKRKFLFCHSFFTDIFLFISGFFTHACTRYTHIIPDTTYKLSYDIPLLTIPINKVFFFFSPCSLY